MMKSIFLSDSSNNTPSPSRQASSSNDDEFILVDHSPGSCSFDYDADTNNSLVPDDDHDDHSKEGYDDDDEYDYCDDAICEGIQSPAFTFSLTEDMILEQAEQPSIQSILDEAHRSASQLITDDESPAEQPPDHSEDQHGVPGILESSASDVSVQSTSRSPPPPPPPPPTEEKKSSDSAGSSATTSPTQSQPPPPISSSCPVGGRMSNKKRRKKMKLLKKAAAAAKAVAALSSDLPQTANTTTTTSSSTANKTSSKKSSHATKTTRYQSKRVGSNLAVACATETLASYKAELKASSAKQKVH